MIALSLLRHLRLSLAFISKVHIALSNRMSHKILVCEEKCLIHLLFHRNCYFSMYFDVFSIFSIKTFQLILLPPFLIQLLSYFLFLQKIYSDFALQGLEDEKLNTKVYQTIVNRIHLEETAASVTETSRDDDYEYAFSAANYYAFFSTLFFLMRILFCFSFTFFTVTSHEHLFYRSCTFSLFFFCATLIHLMYC